MIYNFNFFAESLWIPHSYKKIFEKINSNLFESNYLQICNNYKSKLERSFQEDAPTLKDFPSYVDSDFLGNTIFLKQGQNFVKLGKTSIIAVKPLLLFNAGFHLFNFFMNTVFYFNNFSEGHGLKLIGDTYDAVGVEIKKTGFFQRLINTHAILGNSSIFTPIERISNNEFEKVEQDFDYTKKPELKLRKLIEIKNSLKMEKKDFFDQIDFVFLFIGFSLARHKPSIWHSIVNGEYGDEIIYFKQSFNRIEELSNRLNEALYSIYQGQSSSILQN